MSAAAQVRDRGNNRASAEHLEKKWCDQSANLGTEVRRFSGRRSLDSIVTMVNGECVDLVKGSCTKIQGFWRSTWLGVGITVQI